MEKPLVSIITPCYNGESYVHRFFDSVLQQTYPNLELIFVNDGSVDKTEEVALSYKEKLENRGIQFTYIHQKNAGQAAAINKALPIFKGEYLTWPDSDDWMSEDCIEKKVAYLEAHPEKGFVLCNSAMISDADLTREIGRLERKDQSSGWLFDDLIFERDIYFAPGGYMVRSEMFLKALPERQIYECKTGQNWQLLLPIAYHYECGFLDEVLYFYLVRPNSHSRAEKEYFELVERTYRHQDTLDHVVQSIDMPENERKDYLERIEIKYVRKRLNYALQYGDKAALEQEYQWLCAKNVQNSDDVWIYRRGKNKGVDLLYKVMKLPRRVAGKVKRVLLCR